MKMLKLLVVLAVLFLQAPLSAPAQSGGGASASISWELSPPTTIAVGVTFMASVSAGYTANMPQGEEWAYGSFSTSFQWSATPGGTATQLPTYFNPSLSMAQVVFNQASSQVNGSTVQVTANITGTIIDYGPSGSPYSTPQNIPVSVTATISANLTVYTATFGVRRTGSGGGFGSSATVAAGGIANPVHEADIQITTTPALSGLTFTVEIAPGQGQGTQGGAATLTGGGFTTGTDGTCTEIAAYLSSNTVQKVTLVLLDPYGSQLANATIVQVGGRAKWTYGSDIEYGVPFSISIVLTGRGLGLPLPGHTIGFIITEIDGSVWNDTLQEYVPWVGIPPDQVGPNTLSDLYAIYGPDLVIEEDDLSAYGSFDPADAVTDVNGLAATNLTVSDPGSETTVDTVCFDASDLSVYVNSQ